MANLSAVINQLRRERDRASRELERLEHAIAALDHIGGSRAGRGAFAKRGSRRRRKLSAAARARIAAAQRARWAKFRSKQAK
jgi:hypothetical protein